MRNLILALAMLVCLSITSSAVDATAAWNNVCAFYHFGSYPQGASTTFAQCYSGNDLPTDFADAIAAVSGAVGGPKIPPTDDDPTNATLLNW